MDVRLENPGGLTGVWAEENTRASLWDAMYRKETFGVSGPRISALSLGRMEFQQRYRERRRLGEAILRGRRADGRRPAAHAIGRKGHSPDVCRVGARCGFRTCCIVAASRKRRSPVSGVSITPRRSESPTQSPTL